MKKSTTEKKSALGRRIARLREALDLTQAQLAAHLDLDRPGTISGWENGAPVERGYLRLMSDLCVNDRAIFHWLEGGGPEIPFISRIDTNTLSEWEEERALFADQLRGLADQIDPTRGQLLALSKKFSLRTRRAVEGAKPPFGTAAADAEALEALEARAGSDESQSRLKSGTEE